MSNTDLEFNGDLNNINFIMDIKKNINKKLYYLIIQLNNLIDNIVINK